MPFSSPAPSTARRSGGPTRISRASPTCSRRDIRFGVYLLPGKGEEGIAGRIHDGVRHKERVEMKSMDVRELKVALAAPRWS